ncbi:MAG: hypothetical protein C4582_05290 [Desulfobacteraceae bacterium]|jgi:hypothetical protein|nr:MAG: hypothetical protein C4582_05290 [Desulfobacteraceae bacterium]
MSNTQVQLIKCRRVGAWEARCFALDGEVGFYEAKADLKRELAFKDAAFQDLALLGAGLYFLALSLSRKVNDELLKPLSHWLHDPEWMKSFETVGEYPPDWASYKRRERQWASTQLRLAESRLRHYRRELLHGRKGKEICYADTHSPASLDHGFMNAIVAPFSPPEEQRSRTKHAFDHSKTFSVSNLLPWKLLLLSDLERTMEFRSLKTYYGEDIKRDRVSKLMHLLELEAENRVSIRQEEPFGSIIITPTTDHVEAVLTVTDGVGRDYRLSWLGLNVRQREKIIKDIKAHKILSKLAEV